MTLAVEPVERLLSERLRTARRLGVRTLPVSRKEIEPRVDVVVAGGAKKDQLRIADSSVLLVLQVDGTDVMSLGDGRTGGSVIAVQLARANRGRSGVRRRVRHALMVPHKREVV